MGLLIDRPNFAAQVCEAARSRSDPSKALSSELPVKRGAVRRSFRTVASREQSFLWLLVSYKPLARAGLAIGLASAWEPWKPLFGARKTSSNFFDLSLLWETFVSTRTITQHTHAAKKKQELQDPNVLQLTLFRFLAPPLAEHRGRTRAARCQRR